MGQTYTLLFMAREGFEDDLCWALIDHRMSPDLRDPDTKQTAFAFGCCQESFWLC